MAGLAKGLAILEAFGPERLSLTVSDAARVAGLTRAAARRCLLTLAERGYVAQEGRLFRPLPRLLRLGFAYLRTDPLLQVAHAILASVRDEIGEPVSLAVLEGSDVVFVARAEVSRIVSHTVKVGSRFPAHSTAAGRILLSGFSSEPLQTYLAQANFVRRSPRGINSRSALEQLLAAERTQGFAVSDEDLESGLRAVAVPVKNARGEAVAAMTVSTGAAQAAVETMIERFLPALRRGAETLGRALTTEGTS